MKSPYVLTEDFSIPAGTTLIMEPGTRVELGKRDSLLATCPNFGVHLSEAGNSLPSQVFRLERYARDRGLEIVYRCEFDESAYKSKRQEFERIMKLIRSHREPLALCCDKVDRLIRNFTKDLVTLEEWRRQGKIQLHFPSDGLVLHQDSPATDLFRFTIGVSLAKYYSDSIRDNVKRAFEQKLRNGEWIGPPRLGYMLAPPS